jgi:preprotein translocase subunit SecB
MSSAERRAIDRSVPGTPGIVVDRIFVKKCEFDDEGFDRLFGGESPGPNETDAVNFETTVGTWFTEDDTRALVLLEFSVSPQKGATWTAKVTVVGQFRAEGPTQSVPLQAFAVTNGLAYLIPYVRERLINLTALSRFPTFYLPPLNVRQLTERAQTYTPRGVGDLTPTGKRDSTERPGRSATVKRKSSNAIKRKRAR